MCKILEPGIPFGVPSRALFYCVILRCSAVYRSISHDFASTKDFTTSGQAKAMYDNQTSQSQFQIIALILMELNNLLVSSKTMTIHSIMCCDAKWIVRICSVWELYSRAPGGPGPGTLCRISKHRTTSSPGSSSETLRGVWIWLFNTSKERYWKRLCCHIFDIYVLRTQLILVPQKY